MATLQQLFDDFRRKIELSENQKSTIASSHNHLRQNILQKLDYVDTTLLIGSYKKSTMISPVDDLDIFVILNYETNEIKPQSILDKMKNTLKSSYPNSDIKIDFPCVSLNFNHCKIELTPVIKSYWDTYFLPVRNDWDNTSNPKTLETRLTNKNQSLNNMLIPLIKIMKKMKRNNPNRYRTPSYKMEELAINGLHSIDNYRDGVQKLMEIYEWKDYWQMKDIRNMNDQTFYEKCRSEYFGSDFPKV